MTSWRASLFSIAGRMMSKRGMGKVSFCDLQDRSGRIQLYARKDEMGEEDYNRFKKYDIGDFLGVQGVVFRTQRGEMSVRVEKVTLLSKSLLPLPEKYHGLKDTDARYRQRYVDLIVNPEVKDVFVKRSKIISAIRGVLGQPRFPGGGDPLCCTTRQAAPRPGPSLLITTHWTSTCTCASRWSCT